MKQKHVFILPNQHRPCQIGVRRVLSPMHWRIMFLRVELFSSEMAIFQEMDKQWDTPKPCMTVLPRRKPKCIKLLANVSSQPVTITVTCLLSQVCVKHKTISRLTQRCPREKSETEGPPLTTWPSQSWPGWRQSMSSENGRCIHIYHKHKHIHMHLHGHIHIHVEHYLHIHLLVHMQIQMHLHIHIQIVTNTNTSIHKYI